MVFASYILALLVVLIGLLPNLVVKTLIAPAVSALMDNAHYISAVMGRGL
jgi:formate hydrogenlyase subunit 3/multisubunit Na+/H+ antiporter MnhD subunit